ncbi:MAG: hypothetical protein R3C70_02810 [Geminicoccaceae bacterium]|nr:hypothetical protein [Geminicoccaceae bacterium]
MRCSNAITSISAGLVVWLAATVALAQETAAAGAAGPAGAALSIFAPVVESGLHGFFELLDKQPFVFLLLALAIGYPLGRVSIHNISLGSTAGTLLVGVIIALTAKLAFDITYSIPGLVSTIFLLMFMYALGLKVGPQFFAGLKGGFAFVCVGLTVWSLNWIICVGGTKLIGMEPGFAAGIMSGSYTITAIIGVATSAMQSGAYVPPDGMSTEQVGANIAAGYAVSYVLSSIGIILLIRYLPAMFGRDPRADAKEAEKLMGGSGDPVPGSSGSLRLGFSPADIRAYRVEHETIVGKTLAELFELYPQVPVLRVIRGDRILELAETLRIEHGDIVTVRGDVDKLIFGGESTIGPEVDDPRARDIDIEVADLRIGRKDLSGKTVSELAHKTGYGLQLRALFRQGNEIPAGPDTVLKFGDVARIIGPRWCIERAGHYVHGKPLLSTTVTEVSYMAGAMALGYLVGILSIEVAGIPMALGTSAGCLLAGIFVSYFRSRNPEFGGPVDEGARSFLQDIGLNMFVAVLAANVGPKIIQSFQGPTVIWIALIGVIAALLPPFIGFWLGYRVFGLNSVIADGATTGARNSTPGLNAICAESQSNVAAVPYPITYAFTTVLALLGGYIAMVIS